MMLDIKGQLQNQAKAVNILLKPVIIHLDQTVQIHPEKEDEINRKNKLFNFPFFPF